MAYRTSSFPIKGDGKVHLISKRQFLTQVDLPKRMESVNLQKSSTCKEVLQTKSMRRRLSYSIVIRTKLCRTILKCIEILSCILKIVNINPSTRLRRKPQNNRNNQISCTQYGLKGTIPFPYNKCILGHLHCRKGRNFTSFFFTMLK